MASWTNDSAPLWEVWRQSATTAFHQIKLVTIRDLESCYLVHQCADEFGLKYVAKWNPVQETKEGLQCGLDQRGILGIFLMYKASSQV